MADRHRISKRIQTADTEFVTILIYSVNPYATIAYSHPCSGAIRPDIRVRALLFYRQNLTNSKYPSLMYSFGNTMSSAIYDNDFIYR